MYEGATDATITCEFNYDNDVNFRLLPFAFTDNSLSNVLLYGVSGGGLNPSFSEFFSIEQLQGTLHYTLFILNATISPSNSISTAGVYWCTDNESEFLIQLVVIRKYALPNLNYYLNL